MSGDPFVVALKKFSNDMYRERVIFRYFLIFGRPLDADTKDALRLGRQVLRRTPWPDVTP